MGDNLLTLAQCSAPGTPKRVQGSSGKGYAGARIPLGTSAGSAAAARQQDQHPASGAAAGSTAPRGLGDSLGLARPGITATVAPPQAAPSPAPTEPQIEWIQPPPLSSERLTASFECFLG